MKITIDITDLKDLEDTLARALVRAARTLAREGLLGALAAAHTTTNGATPPAPAPVETPIAASVAPPAPAVEPQWTVQPTPPAPAPPKEARRSLRGFIQTVEHRPDGYCDVDSAAKLITGGAPAPDPRQVIHVWVRALEVKALIVTDAKPPTKGLPGRLMVERESVRERNRLRVANSALAPIKRMAAPKVAVMPPRRGAEMH